MALPTGTFHGLGPPFAYSVNRSRRARTVSVWAAPHAGVVVTCPLAADEAEITRLLARHERWIRRHLAAWARAPIPRRWPYGSALLFGGEEHAVIVREAPRAAVTRAPGALIVHARTPTVQGAARLLKRWYREEARRAVTASVHELAARLAVSWTRIRIADQRSRWGSCSATGALSFNYRLIMMPPRVMSYVVLHELLHRRVFDHSPAFWRAVAEEAPEYQDARRWLRRFGASCAL